MTVGQTEPLQREPSAPGEGIYFWSAGAAVAWPFSHLGNVHRMTSGSGYDPLAATEAIRDNYACRACTFLEHEPQPTGPSLEHS